MSRARSRQKERWALPLLTLEKIGAWAITEPGSGSDAFGGMKSTARRDGDGYVLNGSKTFITNGPYADTIVFICKLDDGNRRRKDRKVAQLHPRQAACPASRSRSRCARWACTPRRPASCSSTTCASARIASSARPRTRRRAPAPRTPSRWSAPASPRWRSASSSSASSSRVDYAKTRVQFGRPIGEFQLIQLKLAKMEVARMNIQNLVFRQIELAAAGQAR